MRTRHLLAIGVMLTLLPLGCNDNVETDGNNKVTFSTDTGDAGDTVTSDVEGPGRDDADPVDDVEEGDAEMPPDDAGDAAPDTPIVDDAGDVGPSDGGDVDTGRDCSVDTDYDGLTDCEEEQLGTDPTSVDTDGDGLGDYLEVENGSDPLSEDTDGDGATDGEEVEFGFDPTKDDTYGDGTLDGDRWVFSSCEDPEGEPVDYYRHIEGDWHIALPPAFSNYTSLQITNPPANEEYVAAAVYGDPANEVTGGIVSHEPDSGQSNPTAVMDDFRNSLPAGLSFQQRDLGSEFDTHDYKRAAIDRYQISTSSGMSARELRDKLLFAAAPFGSSDVDGLPPASGTEYNLFRVNVSVIFRSRTNRSDQVLYSIAVAPNDAYENSEKTQFRMSDLSNTTNVAEKVDDHDIRCEPQKAKERAEADFYWMLDHSGSMSDDYQRVRSVANDFYDQLNITALDFRLGVGNMEQSQGGKFRLPPGWHTGLSTFLSEIQYVIDQSGGSEYGLKMAKQGIEHMRSVQADPEERIRPDAQLITIFMTDEESQEVKNKGGYNSPGAQTFMNDVTNFFNGPGDSIAFSIVATDSNCGFAGQVSQAYVDLALDTGGSAASICDQDIQETIEDIIIAASGVASGYTLTETPISSTLRIYLNGQWVPRSRENGFEYFPQSNSIAFFGSFIPDLPEDGQPDFVSITYETFIDQKKD